MSEKPIRLQLSRKRGFRLRDASRAINGLDAVKVDRSTRFGNPVSCKRPFGCPRHAQFEREAWEDDGGNVSETCCCVGAYKHWLETGLRGEPSRTGYLSLAVDALAGYPRRAKVLAGLASLRGKNLACWCALDEPCHADVLLELANAPLPQQGGKG